MAEPALYHAIFVSSLSKTLSEVKSVELRTFPIGITSL